MHIYIHHIEIPQQQLLFNVIEYLKRINFESVNALKYLHVV